MQGRDAKVERLGELKREIDNVLCTEGVTTTDFYCPNVASSVGSSSVSATYSERDVTDHSKKTRGGYMGYQEQGSWLVTI